MDNKNNIDKNSPFAEVDIKKYKDPEGLTINKLKFGFWFVKNKRYFRLFFIIFLITVSAVSWTYSIYGFTYYLLKGMEEDNKIITNLAQINIFNSDFINRLKPVNLQILPVKVLDLYNGKYDLAVKVNNLNPKHWAEIEYSFLTSAEEVGRGNNFILPAESKYFLSLSQALKSGDTGNVKFNIINLSWHRLDAREMPDWYKCRDDHLNGMTIDNEKFIPATDDNLFNKAKINYFEFDFANNTPYNYWDIDFNIILYRQGDIVGVNRYKLEEVMSEQKKTVNIGWLGSFGLVNSTEVIPEVNIMKDDIYIKYEGEPIMENR